MATTIGEAVIKLRFDTKELDSSQKEAAGKINKAISSIGSVAKTTGAVVAAGLSIASTAVKTLGAVSIKAYAEYEQLQGGIETLFKDSSDDLMKYAKQSYKTAQMSAANYMKTATSFSASLIQGLNGDTKKAADYANRAIISMSDNANKMGTDIERIQDAYRGFARGQFNMLDNLSLGYGGTRTEMQRLISDASKMSDEMGKLGVTVDANSMSFDNIVNAIAVVQEHLGIAGTSAEEAGRTISGSFASMKAAAQDLITGLADPNADLSQLMDNLVTSLVGDGTDKNLGVLGNLEPAIKQAMKGITKILKTGIPKIMKMIPEIVKDVLPDVLDAAVELFNGITSYIPELVQTIISLIGQVAQAIIPQIPMILMSVIQAIIDVIKTLVAPENLQLVLQVAIQFLMAIVDAIPDIVVALIEALPDIIVSIIEFLTDPANIMMIIEAAVKLFMGLVMAVPKILGALFKAFGDLFGKLWERCAQLFKDFAANFGESISGVFKGAVNGVLWFIEGFINGPIDIINMFADGINWVLGGLTAGAVQIGKLSHVQLPRLAEGGLVQSSTLANIGEDGKEAVIPLERNTDNWAGLLAHSLAEQFEQQDITAGRGITVYMTNNINNNLDADEIGERLMTSIRRAA